MDIESLNKMNGTGFDGGVDKFNDMVVVRLDALKESQIELSNEIKHMRRLMEKMVVLEERQNSQTQALTRFGNRLDKFEESLHEVEKCVDSRAFLYLWAERIIMLASGAIIAAIFHKYLIQ